METEDQLENSKNTEHLRPWQFKPGQSGNPGGRPKGSVSLKEYAKRYLMELSDEEKEEFMRGLNKDRIWEMAEGKAESKTDLTSDGKPIQIIVPAEVAQSFNLDAESNPETEGVHTQQEKV